jgi:hypothetical protein
MTDSPSCSPRTPIFIVGYPRSGNSWTAQLLADVLDCPIERYGTALPLSAEGFDRPEPFVVHQLHLRHVGPRDGNTLAIPDGWSFIPSFYNQERIVYVQRDPRDVVVSVKHHWGVQTIRETIKHMQQGTGHFKTFGPYETYCRTWIDWCSANNEASRGLSVYEALQTHPDVVLVRILARLNLITLDRLVRIDGAIKRQAFEAKKAQIEIDGETRPHGITAQRNHYRKGVVGDWEAEFSKDDCERCEEAFGNFIRELGYTNNNKWWEGIKK